MEAGQQLREGEGVEVEEEEEERLVISLLVKHFKVWGPMRAGGVAATIWAESQVRGAEHRGG